MFSLILSAALTFDPGSNHAIVGAYAVEPKTGEVLINVNCEQSMIPASSLKVVTIDAALEILGPEHRFKTDLEIDGVIENGILQGNLYIHGGGDPCLGSNRVAGSLDWKEQIEAWTKAIQETGIQQIQGEVIGDATRWEKAQAVPSWSWEDLGNYYGAGASALSFHENMYALVFKPGSVGKEAEIVRTEPTIAGLAFQNEVLTGPEGSGDQACIYGSEYSFVQYVRGTVPAGVTEFKIKGAIPDPAKFCADLLAKSLESKGIAILKNKMQGSPRKVIHTTLSPTVAEIVYWTNQESINLYAEHLLKRLGEVVFQEGSTRAGIKATVQFWKSKNIDLEGFNMVDGSGLSRKNLVTAKQLVSMMMTMKTSPHYPIFLRSLPSEGGGLKAKSGSMSLILCHVGYAGDTPFALLVNQHLERKKLNKKVGEFLTQLEDRKNSE